MNRTSILPVMLILLATALVAGCNDGARLKQDVKAALAKHTEIASYRFSGEAQLSLPPPGPEQNANPLAGALIAMFNGGRLAWEGTAAADPARLELVLRLTPEGREQTYEIPVLLQDSKMYVHIPAINEPDEYYMIDLEALAATSGGEPSPAPDQLSSAGQLFSTILFDVISTFEPKRFQEADGPPGERKIVIAIGPNRFAEAVRAWYAAAPSIVEQLELAGYISPAKAGEWRRKLGDEGRQQANLKRYRLDEPFVLALNIDEAGFLRETRLVLALSPADKADDAPQWSADVTARYDEINENPPFVMPIPDNIIPITDVLNLLRGGQTES